MFKTILLKVTEKCAYGFGFGVGMGIAFKVLPIERKSRVQSGKADDQ